VQAQLKEAQGAAAAEAAKLAELQQRLDGVEAERVAAQDALAASRQEAAMAQEQLAEARKQVRCCGGRDGNEAASSVWCCCTHIMPIGSHTASGRSIRLADCDCARFCQVASLDELHAKSQRYNGQLQEYNTKLQVRLLLLSAIAWDNVRGIYSESDHAPLCWPGVPQHRPLFE
jgi:multidrug efflux pump subunit AcrA (membrane-fusion protein)